MKKRMEEREENEREREMYRSLCAWCRRAGRAAEENLEDLRTKIIGCGKRERRRGNSCGTEPRRRDRFTASDNSKNISKPIQSPLVKVRMD